MLVPHRPLKLEVEGAIKFIKQNMEKLPNNIIAHANSGFLQTTVEEMVAMGFEVSSQVISRRMKFDKLDELVLEM